MIIRLCFLGLRWNSLVFAYCFGDIFSAGRRCWLVVFIRRLVVFSVRAIGENVDRIVDLFGSVFE